MPFNLMLFCKELKIICLIITFKQAILLACLLLFVAGATSAQTDTQTHQQTPAIVSDNNSDFLDLISPKIYEVLSGYGLCKNAGDCWIKGIYFPDTKAITLGLSFYSIDDLQIVQDIVTEVFLLCNKIGRRYPVEIVVYDEPKKTGFIVSFQKPFFTMEIREE